MRSAPARAMLVRISRVTARGVGPALFGGGLDHGVLAADIVGGDGAVEGGADIGDDV